MNEVYTGAADWEVGQWLNGFYPDDLPPEWRMQYYSNQFSTALMTCPGMVDINEPDNLIELLGDCQPDFRPVLRVSGGQSAIDETQHFIRLLQEYEEEMGIQRLAGVMLSGVTHGYNKSDLLAWRACIPKVLPLALDASPQFIDDNQLWLASQGISPVWRADQINVEGQKYWLGSFSLGGDARQLATQASEFLSIVPEASDACLIAFDGYEVIADLKAFSTIVRLIAG